MAAKQARAAIVEASGESLTPEENQLMADNQAAEHEQPEAAVEEAPAPETVVEQPELALEEDDGDEAPTPADKQRKVDYGALHAERQKRKAAEAAAATAREEIAKFNGRFETLQQLAQAQRQPKAEAPIEIPDINIDPVGHFQARAALADQKVANFEKWQQTQEANATAMNNVNQLTRIAVSHETEFSKKTPDYADAANYVKSMRDQELQYMGYSDPAIRDQIIKQDAVQIAAQALQGNMNAAEVVYNIAKARGYQSKAPAKAAVLAPSQPIGDTKKLTTVANGQKQASPLSEANGSAPAEMSVESILKMSDSDFAKWATPDNWRKVAG